MNQKYKPKYPIYIISKGRADTGLTYKFLEEMNQPYHIVIEKQEYKQYRKYIDKEKILVLPFSNLGQGGIPARNWVWEHAIATGSFRHWIMDDNIDGFWRSNHNRRVRVRTPALFRCHEDFIDRYENVAMSGLNYYMFCPDKVIKPPYELNTRIYSCILLRNDLPYRWRGRYNEDTDLSIRILKDGWCTILFMAMLAKKMPTMTMKGGNTEDLYEIENGRLLMAQSLEEQHPDIVTITRKWDRWQHQVDYSKFKNNKLILKKDVKIPDGINNYGMRLIKWDKEKNCAIR
jgi:hypothetical protein